MNEHDTIASRRYGRIYRGLQRAKQHAFMCESVAASGGALLFSSPSSVAPTFLGIALEADQRLGVVAYGFGCTDGSNNRPDDEHRIQIRYGGAKTWIEDHPLGYDPARVDTTIVIGAYPEFGIFVGLDAALYDPLPMGISVEFKQADIDATLEHGWRVFERDNVGGTKRTEPRAPQRTETVIMFTADRLLDFVQFEREATALGLDTGLRYRAAVAATDKCANGDPAAATSMMIDEFDLTADQLIAIIRDNRYLGMAVRGGVAEFHLVNCINQETGFDARRSEASEPADVQVVRAGDDQQFAIECKNASPRLYADGAFKVEVQRTRASKGDPSSRFYGVDEFDVLGACLFSPTETWEFRYRKSVDLVRHDAFPHKIRPMQRVDDSWAKTLADALA